MYDNKKIVVLIGSLRKESFSRKIAKILMAYSILGVRCNAIAPGAVNTNIRKTIFNPD